jgi:hypothetical protein
MNKFVIFSLNETKIDKVEPIFWNNKSGWGSLDTATIFNDTELGKINMTVGTTSIVKLPKED